MSKEEDTGCKMNAVTCKHKERKPKKPHYIPRPWGKPYNYKCFQCPFTCMEKSHLYNHMKYSLCKNSLSLLIESDWPYKKSNFLIPEMNLHHETHVGDNLEKQDACDSTGSNPTKSRQVGEKVSSEVQRFLEEEEERLEEEEEEAVDQTRKEKSRNFPSLQANIGKSEETKANVTGTKSRETLTKEGEPEFIITDVFSLEGHCDKEREEHRFAKATRKSSSSLGASRVDQWKLLTSTLKKGGTETPVGCSIPNIIPCYPPPTYTEYQEHQGLSLLGLNYPLNTNLFSYLNPTMTSGTAQLPFLASTAQLMHPSHSSHIQSLQNPERSSYLPRFYYPLLFEHAFSTSDAKMAAAKSMSQAQPATTFVATPKAKTSVEPLKTCQLKSPEASSTISLGSGDKLQNITLAHKAEEEVKWMPQTVKDIIQQQKEILGGYGVHTSRTNEASTQKRSSESSPWEKASPTRCIKKKPWLKRDGQDVVIEQTTSLVEVERTSHNSSSSPLSAPDHYHDKSPIPDVTACKRRRDSEIISENTDPMVVNASLLIGDLSRTLEEYGKVEQKLANLTSEDSSRQRTLGEQLGKIRLELLHIHQALEKATCPHEGPLDLSIKRAEDTGKEDPETIPSREEPQTSPSPGCPPKQIVKVELLPPELVTCYARPTKCEADSSVLLCPDGRVGGTGALQPQVAIQEEGGGIGVRFGRGRLQMENV